jgi:Tfp pilus assembly protein PilF
MKLSFDRLSTLPALSVVLLLTGCATAPTASQPKTQAPSELYAGQPQAVHATEFPIASAAEGALRGDAAWREGKLELAVYLYLQALEFDPNAVAILRKIGAIHETLGNRALARRAFEMALTRGGPDAATMERLGLIYIQEGDNAHAQTLLTRTLALDAKRWRAHDGLGVIADRNGDYAGALAHFDAALRIEPRAAGVLNDRGYSRFLAGDLAGAEADFNAALVNGPTALVWTNLGKVQARSRRYGAAFKTYLNTLDTARAYNAVGEGAMGNGDHQIAKTYFENAMEASPSYFEAASKNLALANEALAGRGAEQGS